MFFFLQNSLTPLTYTFWENFVFGSPNFCENIITDVFIFLGKVSNYIAELLLLLRNRYYFNFHVVFFATFFIFFLNQYFFPGKA